MRKIKILQCMILVLFAVFGNAGTAFSQTDEMELYLLPQAAAVNYLSDGQGGEDIAVWQPASQDLYGCTILDDSALFTSEKLYGKAVEFYKGTQMRTISFTDMLSFDFEQEFSADSLFDFQCGMGFKESVETGRYAAATEDAPSVLRLPEGLTSGGVYTVEFDAMKGVSEVSRLVHVLDSAGDCIIESGLRRKGSTAFYIVSFDGEGNTVKDDSNLINLDDWFHVCVTLDFFHGTVDIDVNDGYLYIKTQLQENNRKPAEMHFGLNIDNLSVYNGTKVADSDVELIIQAGEIVGIPDDGKLYEAQLEYRLAYAGMEGDIIYSNDLYATAENALLKGRTLYLSTPGKVMINAKCNIGDHVYFDETSISVGAAETGDLPAAEVFLVKRAEAAQQAAGNYQISLETYNSTMTEEAVVLVVCFYDNEKCVEIGTWDVTVPAAALSQTHNFIYQTVAVSADVNAKVYVLYNGTKDIQQGES